MLNTISWDDFEKIDLRTGTIIEAENFEGLRKPAYKLLIDFGTLIGRKKSSAQITRHYNCNALIGRQVIAIINFPPKQIAGFFSECLVLGIYDENRDVILLKPERTVSNGLKIG
jgi:tRNA-binding protein